MGDSRVEPAHGLSLKPDRVRGMEGNIAFTRRTEGIAPPRVYSRPETCGGTRYGPSGAVSLGQQATESDRPCVQLLHVALNGELRLQPLSSVPGSSAAKVDFELGG
jgi:hypothetical protein